MSRTLVMSATLVGLSLASGCHNYPCPPVGFEQGERFRITVLSLRGDGHSCEGMDVPALGAADAFTLVAGEYVDMESTGCTRLGQPGPAPFATNVLSTCERGRSQLGLMCSGVTAAGCAIKADIGVGPRIAPGVNTISDGVLGVGWSMAATCNSGGCVANYDVAIERLPN
jgi:hypothetical protein